MTATRIPRAEQLLGLMDIPVEEGSPPPRIDAFLAKAAHVQAIAAVETARALQLSALVAVVQSGEFYSEHIAPDERALIRGNIRMHLGLPATMPGGTR